MGNNRATKRNVIKAVGYATAMLAVDYLLSGSNEESHHHHHEHHNSTATVLWNIACLMVTEATCTGVRFLASGVSNNNAYVAGAVDFAGYALLSKRGWFSIAGRGIAAATTALGINSAEDKLAPPNDGTPSTPKFK